MQQNNHSNTAVTNHDSHQNNLHEFRQDVVNALALRYGFKCETIQEDSFGTRRVTLTRDDTDDRYYQVTLRSTKTTKVWCHVRLYRERCIINDGEVLTNNIEAAVAYAAMIASTPHLQINLDRHSTQSPEALADAVFSAYKFGEGVTVIEYDNWDTSDPLDFIKIVYARYDDDPTDVDSHKISFHVRFAKEGNVNDVYGLDMDSGNDVGAGPSLIEKALALGFASIEEMQVHQQWLENHGTLEYQAWVATLKKPSARPDPMAVALKAIEEVCSDFDGNGIYSVGAIAALRAMAVHWKDHLAEGHQYKVISEDVIEMKNQLEVMRAEIMRRVSEKLGAGC